MSTQTISITVTRLEMLNHPPAVPPIYLFMKKGLKVKGFFDPNPLGVLTEWEDFETGNMHVEQVINNEH